MRAASVGLPVPLWLQSSVPWPTVPQALKNSLPLNSVGQKAGIPDRVTVVADDLADGLGGNGWTRQHDEKGCQNGQTGRRTSGRTSGWGCGFHGLGLLVVFEVTVLETAVGRIEERESGSMGPMGSAGFRENPLSRFDLPPGKVAPLAFSCKD